MKSIFRVSEALISIRSVSEHLCGVLKGRGTLFVHVICRTPILELPKAIKIFLSSLQHEGCLLRRLEHFRDRYNMLVSA